ncbi:MAG: hypothetical protein AAFY11_08940 [Cyanobacteria bacterium J06641_5]
MAEETNDDRRRDFEEFSNPYYRYRGKATPQNIVFDANLQEFAYRINVICTLENTGKLSPQDAYKQIRDLWRMLKISKKNLLDAEDKSPE